MTASALRPVEPIHLADRFAPLDAELIALLRRLGPKGLAPSAARERMTLEGDQTLAAGVLGALAIMG